MNTINHPIQHSVPGQNLANPSVPATETAPPTFQTIPKEIKDLVITHLGTEDFVKLAEVSKYLKTLTYQTNRELAAIFHAAQHLPAGEAEATQQLQQLVTRVARLLPPLREHSLETLLEKIPSLPVPDRGAALANLLAQLPCLSSGARQQLLVYASQQLQHVNHDHAACIAAGTTILQQCGSLLANQRADVRLMLATQLGMLGQAGALDLFNQLNALHHEFDVPQRSTLLTILANRLHLLPQQNHLNAFQEVLDMVRVMPDELQVAVLRGLAGQIQHRPNDPQRIDMWDAIHQQAETLPEEHRALALQKLVEAIDPLTNHARGARFQQILIECTPFAEENKAALLDTLAQTLELLSQAETAHALPHILAQINDFNNENKITVLESVARQCTGMPTPQWVATSEHIFAASAGFADMPRQQLAGILAEGIRFQPEDQRTALLTQLLTASEAFSTPMKTRLQTELVLQLRALPAQQSTPMLHHLVAWNPPLAPDVLVPAMFERNADFALRLDRAARYRMFEQLCGLGEQADPPLKTSLHLALARETARFPAEEQPVTAYRLRELSRDLPRQLQEQVTTLLERQGR